MHPLTLLILSQICAASSFAMKKHISYAYRALTATKDDDETSNNDDVLERLTKQYLGSSPELPERQANRLGDLYDAEELSNLLNVHKDVSSRTKAMQNDEQPSEMTIPSIHELVMQAVGETPLPSLEVVSDDEQTKEEESSTPDYAWLTDDIREKMNGIKVIASDVDGTLIGSTHKVHPRTKDAVAKAIQDSFSPLGKLKWFFPATGKTRWGAFNSLGPELAALLQQCPGVFIQGLYCVVGNTVVFEKRLPNSAIAAAEKLVEKTQTSIIAYDGDDLYTTQITELIKELHERYGEPMSKEIPSLAGHAPGIHKILICDNDLDKIAEVRVELEALAKENGATVTQAIPTMLELLPAGCSKALGVQKVCEVLGLDPSTDLLALGDAENDVEMLQMAAVGVCVGNGSKLAKDAADIVLEETSDEGAAGLAIEVLAGL